MPSRSLIDCDVQLADIWLTVRGACEGKYPGRRYAVTCTHRTPEEQLAAYRIGRQQRADGSWGPDDDAATRIVTLFDGTLRKSKHNVRPARALDFMVLVAGKVVWRMEEYEQVGREAEARGLIWGGRWPTLRDGPHLELPD